MALHQEGSKTGPRKAEEAAEDEVTRLPPWRELRAETVEALDLEPAAANSDDASHERPFEQPSEHHEVERELLHTSFAQQLDRANDEELHQAVRRCAVAAHERQRERLPAVRRHEMQEAANAGGRVPCNDDETVASERVHCHGEPTLARGSAPAGRNVVELSESCVVELRECAHLRGVAGLAEPVHGLSHLADRAAFERERRSVDDRLVADVDRAQAARRQTGRSPSSRRSP
jgi:hypothetical protein